MRKARFTEHKVITFLKSVETEHIVKDDWRAAKGYLRNSYYNWKTEFGDVKASDIIKMKDPEDENQRLQKMFADMSL